jgi:rhamnogalacturonyl hydrolase YesR
MAGSVMSRWPDPDTYPGGSFQYSQGYILWGIERMWTYTGDVRYYNYIKTYADEHVDDSGNISGFDGTALENYPAGIPVLFAYEQTQDNKYKLAADKMRAGFNSLPRNSDGGFWHASWAAHQMWIDGIFMGQMYLMRYGKSVGDSAYCHDEMAKQITVGAGHMLKADEGVLHGYDESKSAPWADKTTGLSSEVWSEGMGWFTIVTVEALALMPQDHPQRAAMLAIFNKYCDGLKNLQDSATGMWHQVVDKPLTRDNWHDMSGTGMFVYTLQRGIELGLLDEKVYGPVVARGFNGLLSKLVLNSQGLVDIYDLCEGVGIQDNYYSYINFPRTMNGKECMGSVLLALGIMEKPSPSNNVALKKAVAFSSQQTSNEAARAVDGDTATQWASASFPAWLTIDMQAVFGVNKAEIVPARATPYQYTIQTSLDGKKFITVVDKSNNTSSGTVLSDSFNTAYARYVRLTVTGTANNLSSFVAIKEFRVYKTPPPVQTVFDLAQGKTASSDAAKSGNPASNAADGHPGTYWDPGNANANHWLKIDLGATMDISETEVTWQTPLQAFKYRIEVSQDNTQWTIFADKTNNTLVSQTYSDKLVSKAVRYVRLTITGTNGVDPAVTELRVFALRTQPTALARHVSDTHSQGMQPNENYKLTLGKMCVLPVELRGKMKNVEIYTIAGKLVKRISTQEDAFSLEKEYVPAKGVYVVRITERAIPSPH